MVNQLAEGALMFGISADQVSDAARRSGGADRGFQVTDHDYAISPGGALRTMPNIDGAFQTTRCIFDDAVAENPIGIRVTQHSLIFPRGSDEGYVMLVYTLENLSAGPVIDLYVGMMHDCDYPAFLAGTDTTGFDAATRMGYMFDVTKIAAGPYRGVAVLSDPGVTAFRSINAQGELYSSAT
ncbi:MAG: hypothetical protein GY778_27395, partial [bacterium]|nr:hypothetical protein [bacterium]